MSENEDHEYICFWEFFSNKDECRSEYVGFIVVLVVTIFLFMGLILCLCWSQIWSVLPAWLYKMQFLNEFVFEKDEEEMTPEDEQEEEEEDHKINTLCFVPFCFGRTVILSGKIFADLMSLIIGILSIFSKNVGFESIILFIQLFIVFVESFKKIERFYLIKDPFCCYNCCFGYLNCLKDMMRYLIIGLTTMILQFSDKGSTFELVLMIIRVVITISVLTNSLCRLGDCFIRISFFRLSNTVYRWVFWKEFLLSLGTLKNRLRKPTDPEVAFEGKKTNPVVGDNQEEEEGGEAYEEVLEDELFGEEEEEQEDSLSDHVEEVIEEILFDDEPHIPDEVDLRIKDYEKRLEKYEIEVKKKKEQEELLTESELQQFEREYEFLKKMRQSVKEFLVRYSNSEEEYIETKSQFTSCNIFGKFCSFFWIWMLLCFAFIPTGTSLCILFFPIFNVTKTPQEFFVGFFPVFLSICATGMFAWIHFLAICSGLNKYAFRVVLTPFQWICFIIVHIFTFILSLMTLLRPLSVNTLLITEFSAISAFCICFCVICCPAIFFISAFLIIDCIVGFTRGESGPVKTYKMMKMDVINFPTNVKKFFSKLTKIKRREKKKKGPKRRKKIIVRPENTDARN